MTRPCAVWRHDPSHQRTAEKGRRGRSIKCTMSWPQDAEILKQRIADCCRAGFKLAEAEGSRQLSRLLGR